MINTPKEVLQYPKIRANARIQFAWAIRTEQTPCSLLLRLSHTGQTAVASIPRPGGCRDYMVCPSVPCLRCLLSLVGYLLGDLPVSSLVSSDPAWPARLLTRVYMVCEHVRDQSIHKDQRGSVFTHGPSPCNPYAIQLARYYSSLLSQPSKNGKEAVEKRYQ